MNFVQLPRQQLASLSADPEALSSFSTNLADHFYCQEGFDWEGCREALVVQLGPEASVPEALEDAAGGDMDGLEQVIRAALPKVNAVASKAREITVATLGLSVQVLLSPEDTVGTLRHRVAMSHNLHGDLLIEGRVLADCEAIPGGVSQLELVAADIIIEGMDQKVDGDYRQIGTLHSRPVYASETQMVLRWHPSLGGAWLIDPRGAVTGLKDDSVMKTPDCGGGKLWTPSRRKHPCYVLQRWNGSIGRMPVIRFAQKRQMEELEVETPALGLKDPSQ
mmetsp:Transcript_22843/g.50100  ORF Transcript_22843/g.50100 Transcript_22843/m.50100 type:complete len:278 (+) Transcript_22843:38-871(+)